MMGTATIMTMITTMAITIMTTPIRTIMGIRIRMKRFRLLA
jgi:hypothetical protein